MNALPLLLFSDEAFMRLVRLQCSAGVPGSVSTLCGLGFRATGSKGRGTIASRGLNSGEPYPRPTQEDHRSMPPSHGRMDRRRCTYLPALSIPTPPDGRGGLGLMGCWAVAAWAAWRDLWWRCPEQTTCHQRCEWFDAAEANWGDHLSGMHTAENPPLVLLDRHHSARGLGSAVGDIVGEDLLLQATSIGDQGQAKTEQGRLGTAQRLEC
jgi:hypothetical protein